MLINKINTLRTTGKQPFVLVIGDLMLDHYLIGKASRLSPEAPVPVVNLKTESATLGGAGNVLLNLVALGANVAISGITGKDAAAGQLTDILNNAGINTECIVKDEKRPTTVKTRIIVDNHQLARVDKESVDNLSAEAEEGLISSLIPLMKDADMIVLSDYNKGLFSPGLTRRIIEAASNVGKKVIIDPKGNNYQKYNGAFIIKPNRSELALAARLDEVKTLDDLKIAANIVLEQTEAEYLIVTLSEEGMMIFSKESHVLLPVKATQVYDVTGAGDTVLATIAYFLSLGMELEDVCEVANHAAAIVIRQLGSATTTVDEIIEHIAYEGQKLHTVNS